MKDGANKPIGYFYLKRREQLGRAGLRGEATGQLPRALCYKGAPLDDKYLF